MIVRICFLMVIFGAYEGLFGVTLEELQQVELREVKKKELEFGIKDVFIVRLRDEKTKIDKRDDFENKVFRIPDVNTTRGNFEYTFDPLLRKIPINKIQDFLHLSREEKKEVQNEALKVFIKTISNKEAFQKTIVRLKLYEFAGVVPKDVLDAKFQILFPGQNLENFFQHCLEEKKKEYLLDRLKEVLPKANTMTGIKNHFKFIYENINFMRGYLRSEEGKIDNSFKELLKHLGTYLRTWFYDEKEKKWKGVDGSKYSELAEFIETYEEPPPLPPRPERPPAPPLPPRAPLSQLKANLSQLRDNLLRLRDELRGISERLGFLKNRLISLSSPKPLRPLPRVPRKYQFGTEEWWDRIIKDPIKLTELDKSKIRERWDALKKRMYDLTGVGRCSIVSIPSSMGRALLLQMKSNDQNFIKKLKKISEKVDTILSSEDDEILGKITRRY